MKIHLQVFSLTFLLLVACTPGHQEIDTRNKFPDTVSTSSGNVNKSEIYTRTEIIYGRTYGTALTMDVFRPTQNTNGLGIVLFISEGWHSSHEKIETNISIYVEPLIKKGYTVFAVIHGSNPKFSLLENYEHAKRAVRFIRFNANTFGINPDKIGATGDSAGGHLSLLVGSDQGSENKSATDPIERTSCKTQAVVSFFPPTDFLNWGSPGNKMLGNHPKVALKGAFTFYENDTTTNSLVQITEQEKILEIVKSLSPVCQVNKKTAPTLIVYGDKDSFIPVQQSQLLAKRLKELNVITETIVEHNGEHDEKTIKNNIGMAITWFDTYLKH